MRARNATGAPHAAVDARAAHRSVARDDVGVAGHCDRADTACRCAAVCADGGEPQPNGLKVFLWDPLATRRGWSELGLKATPLMLCAVGLAVCFRANVWNIGAEGQLIAGAIAGGGVALLATRSSSSMLVPAILAAATLGGAAWAAITAWLRDRFHASEILVSLMLVYVAQLLLAWLVHGVWRDPEGFGFPQSKLFESAARMPIIHSGHATERRLSC